MWDVTTLVFVAFPVGAHHHCDLGADKVLTFNGIKSFVSQLANSLHTQ